MLHCWGKVNCRLSFLWQHPRRVIPVNSCKKHEQGITWHLCHSLSVVALHPPGLQITPVSQGLVGTYSPSMPQLDLAGSQQPGNHGIPNCHPSYSLLRNLVQKTLTNYCKSHPVILYVNARRRIQGLEISITHRWAGYQTHSTAITPYYFKDSSFIEAIFPDKLL
jgi:hypothetical protein